MSVIANDTYAERAQLGTLSGRVDSSPTWPTQTGAPDGVEQTNVIRKTSNYTATRYDDVIVVDATGGARTVTLPTAVGAKGVQYTIKRSNSGANTVTVVSTGAETIDTTASYVLSFQYASVTVASDDSNWVII